MKHQREYAGKGLLGQHVRLITWEGDHEGKKETLLYELHSYMWTTNMPQLQTRPQNNVVYLHFLCAFSACQCLNTIITENYEQ